MTFSSMNCVQVHHFRCKQTCTRDPRLFRHVSRRVNCHPQHANVTCPLSERASEWVSEWTNEHAVPFWELLSANQRVLRAVGRTGVLPAIVYLSALSLGIRGTLSLAAGSFARLRAEKISTPAEPVFRIPYLDKASGGILRKVSWALCELSFEMDLYLINAHS